MDPAMLGHFCNAQIVFNVSVPGTCDQAPPAKRGRQHISGYYWILSLLKGTLAKKCPCIHKESRE